MFSTIFRFELSRWCRSPIPYIFGFFLFSISFITMWGMSSEAPTGAAAVMQNSYYRLNNMAMLYSKLMLFLLPAIIGVSIYRDFSSRMYTLLYSYPFGKRQYLLAKFGAAFLVVSIVVGMIGFGFALGTKMPGVKTAALLPFDIMAYVQLYLVFILPNMLIFGTLVFATVAFLRNIYIGFISVILLIMIQGILSNVFGSGALQFLGSLFDPMGETAVKNTIRYWTLEDRNQSAIPMSAEVIGNRVFWLSLTFLAFIIIHQKFQFSQFSSRLTKKNKAEVPDKSLLNSKVQKIVLPKFNTNYSWQKQLQTTWNISNYDFRYIVISWPFLVILLAGLIMVLFQQSQMNPQNGIAQLTTTATMLRVPMFIFTGIINLLTFLYAGVLIYRGKINRMDGLIDIVPQPNWVLAGAKLMAILKVQFLLLTLVMVGGIIAQVINGYYRFELWHYVFELYFLQFIHFLIWACLAFFVHAVFQNMYLSFFLLILVPIFVLMLPGAGDQLGIPLLKESVLQYNQVPGNYVGFDYSDFNGYGTMIPVYLLYKSYWLFAGLFLFAGALLAWKRGLIFSSKERWMQLKSRFHGKLRLAFLLTLVSFLGMGFTIYYNEHYVSETFYTQEDEDYVLAMNEKRYGQLSAMVQPKIAKAKIDMDLYPATRDFVASGHLYFINKVDHVIDTILVAKSFKEITNYQISNPGEVVSQDDELHFDIIKLEQGLAKGDTLELFFEVKNYPNSILHDNSRAVTNGTYITANILPALGVRNAFLSSKKKRAEYGLGDRKVKALMPTDSTLLGYEFAANNMDRIEYETRVSTSADQQAFSMGVLQKKWTEGERNFFYFKSAGEIVNTISWLSGTYDKKEDQSKHQHLELYHHEHHDHNNAFFFQGLKSSLDYCSEWFGPLSHDTLKLIEFPITYGTYATLNGNLIPYSESQFLCNVGAKKNENFNFPFYTTAHEVAHYWWGHRIDPANVNGGKLLTESVAEYLAIKVTEQQFGMDVAKKHRENFRDIYFRIRAQATGELPLINARLNQDYINYQKGGLALYSLSEYLGVNHLNEALRSYEKKNRYAEPPYPTSLDFVDHLSKAVPDSLQYLIKDLFETITIHEHKIKQVNYVKNQQGQYEVSVDLLLSKYRSDGNGKKSYSDNGQDSLSYQGIQSLPLVDYLELGVYNEQEELVQLIDFKARKINERLKFVLDEAPSKIILDPNILLLDMNHRDNEWSINE